MRIRDASSRNGAGPVALSRRANAVATDYPIVENRRVGQTGMNYRDTLEELELRVELNREFDSIARFVIGVCRSLELSEVAHAALDVATRYLSQAASDTDLERARVACWNSIKGRDMNLSDREVASTRAVICATYPRRWPDDAFSGLDAFEDFATAAGAKSDDLTLALRTAFADALGEGAAQQGVAADGAARRR